MSVSICSSLLISPAGVHASRSGTHTKLYFKMTKKQFLQVMLRFRLRLAIYSQYLGIILYYVINSAETYSTFYVVKTHKGCHSNGNRLLFNVSCCLLCMPNWMVACTDPFAITFLWDSVNTRDRVRSPCFDKKRCGVWLVWRTCWCI